MKAFVDCSSGRCLTASPLQILICQNLRNNLQHPNEYIRGVTLRFLCRIREEEILEPLIPSILACLEHRHSYVRRNAVLAINALYRLPRGELLLQDAPELIEKVTPGFAADLHAQQCRHALQVSWQPCVLEACRQDMAPSTACTTKRMDVTPTGVMK
jgi:HEAT repeat protein